MFTYSLDHIPFSLAGSFLIVTSRGSTGRLRYASSSARSNTGESAGAFFEIALLRGETEIPYTWEAQPHRLDLHIEDGGSAALTFADEDTLLFQAEGVTLRLVSCKPFEARYSPAKDHACFVDWAGRGIHQLRAGKKTTLRVSPPSGNSAPLGAGMTVDFLGPRGAIRFSRHEEKWPDPLPAFDKTANAREKEIRKWLKRLPDVPERYRAAAEQAWFVLWNCQAPKGGALTRRAIYMSKFWMNAIWAWDNCFNALAVAEADPDLAWDQLRLFFDHQEPRGMIPDMINDREALYGFTKPPLYGWAIGKLVKIVGAKKALPQLKHLYEPVSRLTEWWYQYRDFDNDGMCQYHHGNDSGWDNATVFDQGCPVEGADLAAYLVLQSDGLAMMGKALKRKISALRWEVRAREQLEDLLTLGVKDGRFISTPDGECEAAATHSLLDYMPLVLGRRLPKELRAALVADLAPGGKFLTEFGLASEAPASPKYTPDGYWRGPIWAAPTYLIFDGLVEMGATELAAEIAERFCNLARQAPGFWENYDALTGQGLRCPGYSWTASVFLLLAQWLARQEKKADRKNKKTDKKED